MLTVSGLGHFKHCRILERNISDIEGRAELIERTEVDRDGEEIEINIEFNRTLVTSEVQRITCSVPIVDWQRGNCCRYAFGVHNSDCEQCRTLLTHEGRVRG